MLPSVPPDKHRNGCPTHAVLGGKFFMGNGALFVAASNFCNLSFGKFVLRAVVGLSSLSYFVGCVIGIVAKKEMGRIDARWIVAPMAYKHSVWNRPIVQRVTVPMRKNRLSENVYRSISQDVFATNPKPTISSGIPVYFVPKATDGGYAVIVITEKSNGLTLDPSMRFVRAIRKIRQLPATAMAVTVWDFVCGRIEEHSNLLGCCVKPRDVTASPGQLFAFPIIPHMGRAF